jgi:pimeloyl-ACP methyl ester carboxylesterase
MLAKAILGQLRRLRHRCRDAALMLTLWLAAFTSGLAPAEAEAGSAESVTRVVDIGDGVTLHYAEQGSGVPVVFVHGSLSDYSYWDPQLSAFSGRYRAIAYSRRYNPPNQNPAITGYSAVTDSDDLAAFVTRLRLGRVYVVGHSYGALAALFLATRHPDLVRAVVLAEPPAASLLQHLPDEQAVKGNAMFADIQKRMVEPMQRRFAEGDADGGVAIFINYVFNDPGAWSGMSQADRTATLRAAREWDLIMTSGQLFPELDPAALRKISVPVLVMSGGISYPFLQYIDQQIVRLIPGAQSIVYPEAGHQMWLIYPRLCRDDAIAFFSRHRSR